MTVKELRDYLADYADDLPIIVECESRCDPHPMGGIYRSHRSLIIHANDRIDIQPNGKPRPVSR